MPESEVNDAEADAEAVAEQNNTATDQHDTLEAQEAGVVPAVDVGSAADRSRIDVQVAIEAKQLRPALPRYESHKRVWALKIKDVQLTSERGYLHFHEEGHGPRTMSAEWMSKHQPKPGGYWLLDEDARESFSSAEVFEAGYTRMKDAFEVAAEARARSAPQPGDEMRAPVGTYPAQGGKYVTRDGKPTGERVPHTASPGMS